MPKPREIREKVLLSLFAHAAQKDDSPLDESTWELTLEPEQDKLNKLSYKALNHQMAALPQRAEEFSSLVAVVAPMMKTYELKKEARTALAISKSVEALQSKFNLLDKAAKSSELTTFYHSAHAVNSSLNEFKTILEEASFNAPELPKLLKCTIKLTDLTQRADLVAHPLNYAEVTSIAALVKATSERDELLEQANSYFKGTLENLEEIDAAIEQHLMNFSPENIGRVERSLLRLGAYEIMILKLAKGIVINETIELSRKFTTEDAVPLINAVLDKV